MTVGYEHQSDGEDMQLATAGLDQRDGWPREQRLDIARPGLLMETPHGPYPLLEQPLVGLNTHTAEDQQSASRGLPTSSQKRDRGHVYMNTTVTHTSFCTAQSTALHQTPWSISEGRQVQVPAGGVGIVEWKLLSLHLVTTQCTPAPTHTHLHTHGSSHDPVP